MLNAEKRKLTHDLTSQYLSTQRFALSFLSQTDGHLSHNNNSQNTVLPNCQYELNRTELRRPTSAVLFHRSSWLSIALLQNTLPPKYLSPLEFFHLLQGQLSVQHTQLGRIADCLKFGFKSNFHRTTQSNAREAKFGQWHFSSLVQPCSIPLYVHSNSLQENRSLCFGDLSLQLKFRPNSGRYCEIFY